MKTRLWGAVVATTLFLPSLTVGARQAPRAAALSEAVLRQKIVNYLHNYGYYTPEVQLDPGPFESSQNPAYYECLVTARANGKVASETDSISKNGRYLARSAMYYLGPDTKAEVLRNIRVRFKLGTEWQLSAGPLATSPVPGFLETSVTAERNGKKQSQNFYITDDKHFAILGQLFVLRTPKEVESLINTRNQPHSGPLDAPVTIVEYADLECPMCGHLQPFLENELLPRYGNKVRLIYKDFPLPEHDWSREAAIANQCAYDIDPSAFAAYRTSIFAHQTQINVTNVRDMLLQLGEQAGINQLRLAACLDAKTTLPRIEADYNEAIKLQVNFTPTCFIDGHPVVGAAPPEDYYRIIDEELRSVK
ncbi:MAG: DsbA family protein [Terriglobia bacterium]